jgi:hypothetical protein
MLSTFRGPVFGSRLHVYPTPPRGLWPEGQRDFKKEKRKKEKTQPGPS